MTSKKTKAAGSAKSSSSPRPDSGRQARGAGAANPKARIFARLPLRGQFPSRRAVQPAAGFDYPATLAGNTAHFQVYYETGFADGPTVAAGVLATVETDYAALSLWFGGLPLPTLPINVILAPGIGGAYHYGCAAVDLYCDADHGPNPDVDLSRMLVVAEEVEVFEAAQGRGWNCGASNGEGLSRVLATERYPAQLNGFATAAAWLNSPNRPDWVSRTDPSDQHAVSTGCAVLFLNYLRYQLGYEWTPIIAAAGAALEATYNALTGRTGGFAPFKALLDAHFPPGQPAGLATDNPFPLT